jgi:hypothetical protein
VLTVLVQRDGSPQRITPTSGRTAFENNGTPTAPMALTGIQVVVHPAGEDRTPQANHFGSNLGGQRHEMSHEPVMALVCDHDMEGDAEKRVV